ncbi:unnamed protein product [Hanseniaspora opuntiae]
MSFFNFDYSATNSSLPHPIVPLPVNQASTNKLSFRIAKNYKKMTHLFKTSQFYTGSTVPLDILDKYNKVDDGIERFGDKYKQQKVNKLTTTTDDNDDDDDKLDHPFHLEFIPQELKSVIKKTTNNKNLQKQAANAASSAKLLTIYDPESKKEPAIDDIDFNKEFSKYITEEDENKENLDADNDAQANDEDDGDDAFDDEDDDGDYDAENYFDNGEDDVEDDNNDDGEAAFY